MSKELGDLSKIVNQKLGLVDAGDASAKETLAQEPSTHQAWFDVVKMPAAAAGLDNLVHTVKERLGAEGHPGFPEPSPADEKTLDI